MIVKGVLTTITTGLASRSGGGGGAIAAISSSSAASGGGSYYAAGGGAAAAAVTPTAATTTATAVRRFGTWPKVRPRRIRAITMDVTGTLVSFRGTLEDHYLGSARKCGVEFDEGAEFAEAFHFAYKEMCRQHPCFGGSDLTAKEWWKRCVLRSFELAGATMSPQQQDVVFQRIYSTFGSHAAYEIFEDALPFLHWAQRHNLACGVLSNADERYGDSILPMLGLTADNLQFQCYSKDHGIEKPNAAFYQIAMDQAQPWLRTDDELHASEVLHIGNDYAKDFEGARRAGLHAVLLDRYKQTELAQEWRRRGAEVFTDLSDVVYWLGRSKCQLG